MGAAVIATHHAVCSLTKGSGGWLVLCVRGDLIQIRDIHLKAAKNAGVVEVLCPANHCDQYYRGRDHRPSQSFRVTGVKDVVELLQLALKHPSPPRPVRQQLACEHDLGRDSFIGSAWAPLFIQRKGVAPKAYRQEIICLCVAARRGEIGDIVKVGYCHEEHLADFVSARVWARGYAHNFKALCTARVDLTSRQYYLVFGMPPTGIKKDYTPV